MTKQKIMSEEPDQTCPNINRMLSELKDLQRLIDKNLKYAEGELANILGEINNTIWDWDYNLEEIRQQNIALRDWGNLCLDNVELKNKEY